jgi:hypothetical protein
MLTVQLQQAGATVTGKRRPSLPLELQVMKWSPYFYSDTYTFYAFMPLCLKPFLYTASKG